MAATEEPEHDLSTAHLEAQLVLEGLCRSGQAGDSVGPLEEARHAPLLARPVLQAALLDELVGHGGGDDPPRREG